MKKAAGLIITSILSIVFMTNTTFAQFKLPPKKKANNPAANNAGNTGSNVANNPDSSIVAPPPVETAPASTQSAATYDPNAKPVKRYDTSNVGGFNSIKKVSLRANSVFSAEKNKKKSMLERTPLPYQKLREEDAIFSEYVWEEIDGREKLNRPFTYQGYDDSGDQRFFALIMKSIEKEDIVAFDAEDDRFTTPLSVDEVQASMRGRLDTLEVQNVNNPNIMDTVITFDASLAPKTDSIFTFRIKEQYIFDNKTSRMYCRIIGIAPIANMSYKGKNFQKTLFWIYYPDFRPILAKHEVYNPKNFTTRMTWEELFESRYFNGHIVKSTIDNYNDLYLKDLYKDPIKRLEAGEKIRQRIFTFEQDRWVY